MSNVVPLYRPISHPNPKLQPFAIACNLVVDPASPPRVGQLLAWGYRDGTIFVDRYEGRTGRDSRGRFCPSGAPYEVHGLGGWLGYTDLNVAKGAIIIHGLVVSDANMFFWKL